jgi:hypothetical protein
MACGSSLYHPMENTCCLSLKVVVGIAHGYLYQDIPFDMHDLNLHVNHPNSGIRVYAMDLNLVRPGDHIWRQVTNLGTHSLFLVLNYPMNVNILGGTLTIMLNVVADALSREPCSLNALLKTSQPTLCEEFERFGLEFVSHWFLANLEVRPTLFDQIKEAQKGHESIEGIKHRMGREEVPGFSIDQEGVLWYNGLLCVPNIDDLKQLILKEAHDTPYSIHLRKCIKT